MLEYFKEGVISINTKNFRWLSFVVVLALLLTSCTTAPQQTELINVEYKQESSVEIFRNIPQFKESELTTKSFEKYSKLDYLGRCGVAFACIGKDIMPTEEREAIGQVKPSGWQLVKYDIVDGKYLYNRCHLIGYQLTGENANEKNLITGTRSMNVDGMLPYENMVAEYVKETNNHVMYRVTPVYEGNNLLAKGVQIEALSVEDNGEGVCFNVFVFNVQPGVKINYADGTSELIDVSGLASSDNSQEQKVYVLNKETKKIHYPTCSSVDDIQEKNKETFNGTKEELLDRGYTACGRCEP